MGFTDDYAERLRRKQLRFRKTHLGAEQRTGDAGGQGVYSYTAYHECSAAAVLECVSLVATVVLIGIAFVLLSHADSIWYVLIALAAVILFRHLTKWLIRLLNNAIVKRKIRMDAEFAAYFALQYPEHAQLCTELNEIYAANPDAIPAEEIRTQINDARSRDEKILRAIGYAGLGFLILTAIAFVLFIKWVIRETT